MTSVFVLRIRLPNQPLKDHKIIRLKPSHFRGSVDSVDDGYWTHYLRRSGLPKPYRELIEAIRVTGKYLFFSEDRSKLVNIAVDELENHNFREAKVNNEGTNIGPEYVLCLYFRDDTRKHELAERYQNAPGIKYRYWKSDSDTREGKYSQEFLGKLSPEKRNEFKGSQEP